MRKEGRKEWLGPRPYMAGQGRAQSDDAEQRIASNAELCFAWGREDQTGSGAPEQNTKAGEKSRRHRNESESEMMQSYVRNADLPRLRTAEAAMTKNGKMIAEKFALMPLLLSESEPALEDGQEHKRRSMQLAMLRRNAVSERSRRDC